MGSGKINALDKYLEGQWAWRPLMDGLFCHPAIVPMDLDGLIEHRGYLLYIERKHEGAKIGYSASLTFNTLIKQPRSTVLILWWDEPENVVAYQIWGNGGIQKCDNHMVREFVKKWHEGCHYASSRVKLKGGPNGT